MLRCPQEHVAWNSFGYTTYITPPSRSLLLQILISHKSPKYFSDSRLSVHSCAHFGGNWGIGTSPKTDHIKKKNQLRNTKKKKKKRNTKQHSERCGKLVSRVMMLLPPHPGA